MAALQSAAQALGSPWHSAANARRGFLLADTGARFGAAAKNRFGRDPSSGRRLHRLVRTA